MSALTILFAAIAPFVLFFIETILPYPAFLEEVVKFGLVLRIPANLSLRQKLAFAACIGLIFSITESVLYTFNIYPTLNTNSLLLRFLLPILMHTLTSVIMLLFISWNKKLAPLGLVIAVFTHYLFNKSLSL